ncbi:MAG: tetratricopeptide (TPR) repeat protein [Planctomycetota bacterium]|jgi:tetratricopeptide (TPR) repeat protein
MKLLTALLVLACFPSLTPASAWPAARTEDLSLEDLLKRYREQREGLLATYRAKVNSIVAEMESAITSDRRNLMPGLRESLVKLGPQAAPLLVKHLEPGINAEPHAEERARSVARVLREVSTRSITVELLAMLRKGTSAGQSNALTALSGSDDPERVGPVLREMFAEANNEKRAALIIAIANLGGPDDLTFLGGILKNENADIVKSALAALAISGSAAAGPNILELIRDTYAAAPHVPAIIDYYHACPEVLDSEHCKGLVDLARGLRSNAKMAVLVLKLVGQNEEAWTNDVEKELKKLSEVSSSRVSEAALICLARAKDRGAKKKLMESYDARIKANEGIASAWQNRADVKYRIADYKGAIKDFEMAHKVSAEYLRTEPEVYEGLARCHSLLGKPKDAARWLGEGGLSLARLHQLAKDPDFAKLAADPKYNRVFRLGED